MTMTTPALALKAANDNPGGSQTATLAVSGLIGLLARAEARAIAGKGAANDPISKTNEEVCV